MYSRGMTTQPAAHMHIDPTRPLSDYAGIPMAYVDTAGARHVGVTEVSTGIARMQDKRLIVRFPNGQWAFAATTHRVGAPVPAKR